MQITISEEKTKELLKEILVEMIESKQELFYEILTEALGDWIALRLQLDLETPRVVKLQ